MSFGGALGGTLDVNASAVARALPRGGAGLCLNYLLDGPGADNGTALTQALQARLINNALLSMLTFWLQFHRSCATCRLLHSLDTQAV